MGPYKTHSVEKGYRGGRGVADGPKGGLSVVKDRRKRSSKAPLEHRLVIYTQFIYLRNPSLCLGLRIGEGAEVARGFVLTFFLRTCFVFHQ